MKQMKPIIIRRKGCRNAVKVWDKHSGQWIVMKRRADLPFIYVSPTYTYYGMEAFPGLKYERMPRGKYKKRGESH